MILSSPYNYLRNDAEMRRAFGDSALLRNTLEVASWVENYDLGTATPKLPVSPAEAGGRAPAEILVERAVNGLGDRLGGTIPPAYNARLMHELGVIRTMGEKLGVPFERYLLNVAGVTDFCRANNIRFGPRGSAAGSIIAFALGISELDPLKEGLLFERFLNENRVELPDIDIDVADNRRDEVMRYLLDEYGTDRVAKIGTYTAIGARMAIKDGARAIAQPEGARPFELTSRSSEARPPRHPRRRYPPGGVARGRGAVRPDGRRESRPMRSTSTSCPQPVSRCASSIRSTRSSGRATGASTIATTARCWWSTKTWRSPAASTSVAPTPRARRPTAAGSDDEMLKRGWRDTHIELRGPVVRAFARGFGTRVGVAGVPRRTGCRSRAGQCETGATGGQGARKRSARPQQSHLHRAVAGHRGLATQRPSHDGVLRAGLRHGRGTGRRGAARRRRGAGAARAQRLHARAACRPFVLRRAAERAACASTRWTRR